MSVSTTQVNPQTGDQTIYLDRMTRLNLTLTNDGDPISVSSETNPSTLKIYLPNFFSPDDLNIMTIDQTDWEFGCYINETNINNCYLSLSYIGDDYNWDNNEALTFTIELVNVVQSAKELPYGDSQTQIQLENFGTLSPFIPSVPENNLILEDPSPTPGTGTADLKEVLQVFLNNQGRVYVSSSADPLQNTLYLNFKNIVADTPISTVGGGQVTVKFIYGNTSGALTTDDGGVDESAWNIVAAINNAQGNDWSVTNPDISDGADHPSWVLSPENTNTNVIGYGANANISFSFAHIISFLPTGNTQMLVQFSGFKKDADTEYNEATFVLNIVKLEAPILRGLTDFYSGNDSLRFSISKPTDEISLDLFWSMYYVDKVVLSTSVRNSDTNTFSYANPQSETTDNQSLTLTNIYESGTVSIIAQAFDGNARLLNSMELTIYVESTYIPDKALQAFQQYYPIIRQESKIFSFYSPTTQLTLTDPSGGSIDLHWTMYNVNHVKIKTNIVGYTVVTVPSGNPTGFAGDSTTINLPDINDSQNVVFTIEAFDGSDQLLDSMQFSVFVLASFFLDPSGIKYTAIAIGSKLWMTEDLNYKNSVYHINGSGLSGSGGWLASCYYKMPDVGTNCTTGGWRLPKLYEWLELSSDSLENLSLSVGGYYNHKGHQEEVNYIYYWSITFDSVDDLFASACKIGTDTLTKANLDKDCYAPVRYVRDIPFS